MTELTHARLKELLHYNRDTGDFTWIVRPSYGTPAGSRAGSTNSDGYVLISIDGKRYAAHRLAVFYMTHNWPSALVDHKNGDRGDNRWTNLRQATYGQNKANTISNNPTGFKGVTLQGSTYVARICKDHKSVYLGRFASPEEAHHCYVIAAKSLHGEFARAG